MYVLISVIVLIICVLLILIVLVQNSKGGGLAANFQGSTQIMGVRRTTDFLEKSTWTLAVALMLLCVLGSIVIPRAQEQERSVIEDQIQNVIDPNAIPTFPSATPDNGGSDDGSQAE
ncbi:MAG: preprotein translocase subunit SecG [Bacteroides sp. SM23_62_1]|nr:MAG: preprotein translocase subunit SecG [Bacteroides sp. SM23_62_1]